MYSSQQPLHWSAQFGPSPTNSYVGQQQIDRAIQNPEGMSIIH